ncbi:MAG TPA: PASTA domain-containing protein [Solirubrobacterales bacterium]
MRGGGRIAGLLGVGLLCGALLAPAAADARTIRTAAIVVYFENEPPPTPGPDEPVPPDPLDAAEATLFGSGPAAFGWSARHYFQTITYGLVDFAGGGDDVYGHYEIGPYEGSCAYSQWTREATEAAETDGFEASAYDHVVYYLDPSLAAAPCAYGIGAVGYAFMKGIGPYVTIHELAHGLTDTPGQPGAPHANAMHCIDTTTEPYRDATYSDFCIRDDRADPFDPMGFGLRGPYPLEMSAWRKLEFGAIQSADAPIVHYAGTYTIAPLEQSSGVRLLRIRNGAGQFFDLDFRQPIGLYDGTLSSGEPVTNGVTIRLHPPTFDSPDFPSPQGPYLLDATPETPSYDDAPLMPGRQFRDFRTGVTVETLSAGPGGATVKIGGLPEPPASCAFSQACGGPRNVGPCKVPGLKRKKVRAARKAVRKRECRIGKVRRRPSRKVPKGRVISQKPKAGAQRREGAKVSLVVSSGPPKRR